MTTDARAPGEAAGHLALVAVQLCFGLLPLFGKWAFEGFEPRAVAAWRIGGGALVFAVLAVGLYGRRAIVAWRDVIRLQVCGLLGVTLNMVLFLEGLERTTTVNSGLMMLLIPVFTYGIAVVVRQERFRTARALGILIACAATGMLVLQKEPDLGRPYLVGNLLIAANTLSFSVFLVISRPMARRYPPLVMVAWIYVLGAWMIPLFAQGAEFVPAGADRRAWISLGLILLFPTVLGYLLNLFALSRVAASTTAVYVFVQPLIAAAAGALVLGEVVRGPTVLVALTIFAGIWLVVRRPRQ